MEKRKILIVDDDANIAELIALYLTKECFQCEIAEDGETALEKHQSFQPDLILLDIMLPGIDGYDVLREIRKQYTTPVIMLSAKGETFDKVLGLELGADDYIIKPFDSKELVARVKAVLRRFQPSRTIPVSATAGKCVEYPDLIINQTNYSVIYQGRTVDMPPKELERRCGSLGAELLPSNADFCARFDFAPRYPVWLKVWFADEEFPASGRLLLDESAPRYLTIEDAVTVGSLILDQLTGAQHWTV